MYSKRNKIYARKKKKNRILPTLIILTVSAVAALGGTFYWQMWQLENEQDHQIQASLDEQLPKETPTIAEPPKPTIAEPPPKEALPVQTTPQEKDSLSSVEPPAAKNETTNTQVQSKINSTALVAPSERVKKDYFTDAAFVGDSITQGILSYEICPEATVIAALGINLDTVYKEDQIRTKDGNKSVLQVLSESAPKKIYIMFGANGVGWFTKEHFSKTYGEFVDKVKEQQPDSEIYLQSILPVTKDYKGSKDNINNSKIDEYNLLVVDIAEQKGVHYLDVASVFKDENGALPEDSNGDGMHFSPTYYNKWFDYLKTHTATEE